jgi:hypothetical protein
MYNKDMNNQVSTRVRKHQTPVFIIENFDKDNIEHIKGNVKVMLNRPMAMALSRLISEVDLTDGEGALFKFNLCLKQWYNRRYNEFLRRQQELKKQENNGLQSE